MACGIKRVTWIFSNQIYGINPKIGNNPKIFLETFLILYIWRNMLGLAGGWLDQMGDSQPERSTAITRDMEHEICIKRFTDLRRELGHTQAEFAQLLGVRNTTADIERGRTKLSGKVVSELLKQFKINPMWLFGESDQKHLDTSRTSVIPKVVTVDSSDNDNMVLVNAKAAAGYPQNIADTSWYRQLPAFDLPIPEFRNATYRGFQVEGDSMLPSLRPNDWVLARAVDHIDHVSPNKMYVVVLQDSVM